jgi:lipopolysaccharide biosynthesis glycosyltransferase
MKNLIVSSADSKYSHLLIELYHSLKPYLIDKYDFAILDCGLNDEKVNYFIGNQIKIVKPDWEFDISSYKIRGRENLKIQFSRFYLDKYFPGYENYIWLDSDTWVNCPDTFDLYLKGAEISGFSITPQVDRAYQKLIDIKWLIGGIPKKINTINFKNISKSVSLELAKKFAGNFTLNAGCFAYNIKFDGLDRLRSNLRLASKKGRIFGSDQVALALTLFNDGISFELLPSYCNWLCVTKVPKYSNDMKCFVEPYLPNHKIGVMHLAGMDLDRKEKLINHKVQILEGGEINMPLRYSKKNN